MDHDKNQSMEIIIKQSMKNSIIWKDIIFKWMAFVNVLIIGLALLLKKN